MSKAKTTYSHITYTGETCTVNSTRVYTHVIVVGPVRTDTDYIGAPEGKVVAWSGSAEAAARRVAEFAATNEGVHVEAINGGTR